MGPQRWGELSEAFVTLSNNVQWKVRLVRVGVRVRVRVRARARARARVRYRPTLTLTLTLTRCALGTAMSYFAFLCRAAVSATSFTVVGNVSRVHPPVHPLVH